MYVDLINNCPAQLQCFRQSQIQSVIIKWAVDLCWITQHYHNYISLESTHWELSNVTKNKYVDLINNGPAQFQYFWPSNHKIIIKWSVAVCGPLLNHSTLPYFISLETTHWELSNDTKNKYVDLINNGPAQLQFFWPS